MPQLLSLELLVRLCSPTSTRLQVESPPGHCMAPARAKVKQSQTNLSLYRSTRSRPSRAKQRRTKQGILSNLTQGQATLNTAKQCQAKLGEAKHSQAKPHKAKQSQVTLDRPTKQKNSKRSSLNLSKSKQRYTNLNEGGSLPGARGALTLSGRLLQTLRCSLCATVGSSRRWQLRTRRLQLPKSGTTLDSCWILGLWNSWQGHKARLTN